MINTIYTLTTKTETKITNWKNILFYFLSQKWQQDWNLLDSIRTIISKKKLVYLIQMWKIAVFKQIETK